MASWQSVVVAVIYLKSACQGPYWDNIGVRFEFVFFLLCFLCKLYAIMQWAAFISIISHQFRIIMSITGGCLLFFSLYARV